VATIGYTDVMPTTTVIDWLSQSGAAAVPAVCVLGGGDAFLKRQAVLRLREAVLGGEDAEFSFTAFDGETATLSDVMKELATVAMFGGGKRLIVVDDADEFVTRYRTELEDYVARPRTTGVLVLAPASFPSNTRLHKAVAAAGLVVDCSAPSPNQMPTWLTNWAAKFHQVKLDRAAAGLLIETIGPEPGLLDQELAKLALVAGDDRKVTGPMVQQMVGGWRARTTWEMLDATLAGDVAGALGQLERLLAAGETPVGLLAQVSASLRRLAAATRLILQGEAAGRPVPLRQALEQVGVRSFVLQKSERELRRLGRQRGSQLYRWLLEADLDLKGDSSLPPRLILERLLVRLAAPPEPATRSKT
jgi:DNA polymerase-3 subunit delta